MDTTDCLELPFPECAPPLVKDKSDIEQFRDLAVAADTAVQTLADSLSSTLFNTPSTVMSGGSVVAGRDVTHFTPTTVTDNAGQADTAADVIRIAEDGWYMVGGWVSATSASLPNSIGLRIEPIVNGDTVSNRQGPGQPAVGAEYVAWADSLFLRAGDTLQTMTHHTDSAALNVTYQTFLWAHQVIASV